MSDFGPHTEALVSEFERKQEQRLAEWSERGIRAMLLSPTLEITRALLRDEAVPVDRLDKERFVRFGGRRRR